MSKCKKTKNPCKICLGPVTHKTGLQCQGACEGWVHFACLNYTPGKIRDIKAGVIKVTCPCPDCKSTLPKEYRTDQPFSCTNMKCPANKPPKCENTACPINHDGPDKMIQTSANPPCPLNKCGVECKKHAYPKTPESPGAPSLDPCLPQGQGQPKDFGIQKSPSACSSQDDIPGDFGQLPMSGLPSLGALEQMCNTVGQLTNQINCLMSRMKEAVESGQYGGGGQQKGCRKGTCPKPCYCPSNPRR